MSNILQIATEKPITNFLNNNIKEYCDGDIIAFKYGGLYYSRFVIIADVDDSDNTSAVYKIIMKHIRNIIRKSWLFERERCRDLKLSIKKPFYLNEESVVSISI